MVIAGSAKMSCNLQTKVYMMFVSLEKLQTCFAIFCLVLFWFSYIYKKKKLLARDMLMSASFAECLDTEEIPVNAHSLCNGTIGMFDIVQAQDRHFQSWVQLKGLGCESLNVKSSYAPRKILIKKRIKRVFKIFKQVIIIWQLSLI